MLTFAGVIGVLALIGYLIKRMASGSFSTIVERGHPAQRLDDIQPKSGDDGNDGG